MPVSVALAPALLARVPLTALASVLVLTGYRLLNIPKLVAELKHKPKDGLLWVGSSLLILFTDLLTGLGLSLLLASLMNYREVIASATTPIRSAIR